MKQLSIWVCVFFLHVRSQTEACDGVRDVLINPLVDLQKVDNKFDNFEHFLSD